MIQRNLTGQQSALAKTWVPFFCGLFRGGVIVPGTSILVENNSSEFPSMAMIDGKTTFYFGDLVVQPNLAMLDDFMSTGTLDVGDLEIFFPGSKLPSIVQVPGGLSLKWSGSPTINTVLGRFLGTSIEEVLVYPDRAEFRVAHGPDAIITWE